MAQSLADLAYRTAANIVGGPVDIATMLMRPFGYAVPDEQIVGGSEWIGKKIEQAGLISQERAPIREMVTSLLAPSPAAIASKAMFIGGLAKTWNASAATKAKKLEALGVDARKIWQETGTWRGPDGKWRQEISDKDALFNASLVAGKRVENDLPIGYAGLDLGPTVGGILEHQPLQAAYGTGLTSGTRIGNKNTMFGDGVQGAIDASGVVTINAPAKADQARSTTLHELQHAIQQHEGFARGGSSTMAFLPQNKEAFALLAQKRREMHTPLSLDEYTRQAWGMDAPTDEVQKAYADYVKTIKQTALSPEADRAAQEWAGKEYYRRLAGEAEARATQARANMTQQQRMAMFPEDSYDVPIGNLIVRK